MLANGGDTDLLEQIVKLLTLRKADLVSRPSNDSKATSDATVDKIETVFASVAVTASGNSASVGDVPEKSNNVVDEVDATVPTPQEQLLDLKLRIKWLKAIAEFDKFDLMVQFSSQALLKDVVEVLSMQPSSSTELVVAKYQNRIKV